MSSNRPNPSTWTLRLKIRKATVILHVDPLQEFRVIASTLLRCLKITHPSGQLYGYDIPSNPGEVILAKPNDIYDVSKGWTKLDILTKSESIDLGVYEDDSNRKKKKPDLEKKAKGQEFAENCPKTAGLKDGSVLAFKFRAMLDESLGDEDEQWDVQVPSYDDAAGSINESNVDESTNYTG